VDAVLLYMLWAVLFYPTRDDIIQTNNFCLELAVVISTRLLQELRDESKVTYYYLESMNGIYSASVVSKEECKTAMGIETSNNISESVHGMLLETCNSSELSDLIVVLLVVSKIATVIGIEIMLL